MPSSEAIVTAARSWVGTPLRAGPAAQGVAVDDWGLVRAVGEAAGLLTIEVDAALVAGARRALAEAMLHPIETGETGDVALVDGRLAILADHNGRATLIRVDGAPGSRVYASGAAHAKVVEHGFTGHWPGRVEAWFRYPGLS
jgi:hypothetical protein